MFFNHFFLNSGCVFLKTNVLKNTKIQFSSEKLILIVIIVKKAGKKSDFLLLIFKFSFLNQSFLRANSTFPMVHAISLATQLPNSVISLPGEAKSDANHPIKQKRHRGCSSSCRVSIVMLSLPLLLPATALYEVACYCIQGTLFSLPLALIGTYFFLLPLTALGSVVFPLGHLSSTKFCLRLLPGDRHDYRAAAALLLLALLCCWRCCCALNG